MFNELVERAKRHPIVTVFTALVAFAGGVLVLMNFCERFDWCSERIRSPVPVAFVSSFLKTTDAHVRLVKHLRETGATIEEPKGHTCQMPNPASTDPTTVHIRYSDPKWEPAIRALIDSATVHFAGLHEFAAPTKVARLQKPVDVEVYAGHNPQGESPLCVNGVVPVPLPTIEDKCKELGGAHLEQVGANSLKVKAEMAIAKAPSYFGSNAKIDRTHRSFAEGLNAQGQDWLDYPPNHGLAARLKSSQCVYYATYEVFGSGGSQQSTGIASYVYRRANGRPEIVHDVLFLGPRAQ